MNGKDESLVTTILKYASAGALVTFLLLAVCALFLLAFEGYVSGAGWLVWGAAALLVLAAFFWLVRPPRTLA